MVISLMVKIFFDDVRVVCDGDVILVDFQDKKKVEKELGKAQPRKEYNPRITFLGKYDSQKKSIDSFDEFPTLFQDHKRFWILSFWTPMSK